MSKREKRNIYIDGVSYEVTEDEYRDFYKSKNHSQYLRRIEKSFTTVSYEKLTPELSCEDIIADSSVDVEEQVVSNILVEQLVKSYDLLDEDEFFIIQQLFYENKSRREVAELLGISHTAVNKRWDKLKSKLKKLLGF